MYTVYWIRHSEHTDAYQQGYVGISASVHTRWNQHKLNPPNVHFKNAIQKYGWGNLVKQVVFTGSKEACLAFEVMLRPTKKIGWNLEAGGGLPPKHYGDNNPMRDPKIAVKVAKEKHGGFIATVIATNIKTGEQTALNGRNEMKSFGFDHCHVYKCVAGERKQHKGHTFTRIIKE